ncbi:MAG: hypothetical protein V9G17_04655 [Nitrospira sp.]|nr:hypothetical protein [Nitrospira sp.]HQY59317.1 hypothetical protein [Nitrospira sp.]HRA97807.1 hypothetical protein [Nitrospira sp.]
MDHYDVSQDKDCFIKEVLESTATSLEKLGRSSFSVFYSNPWMTLEKGKYYIVGLNPGGAEKPSDRQDHASLSVRYGADGKKDWSAYLVESEGEKWESALQPNISAFANCCMAGGRESLRRIFSTNAIFARSPDSSGIAGKKDELFNQSWPWHVKFLERVRPEIIIAISNREGSSRSAYQLFSKHLEGVSPLGDPIEAYGTFSIKGQKGRYRLSSGPLDVRLIGLPHLSRWSPTSAKSAEAIAALKQRGWLD